MALQVGGYPGEVLGEEFPADDQTLPPSRGYQENAATSGVGAEHWPFHCIFAEDFVEDPNFETDTPPAWPYCHDPTATVKKCVTDDTSESQSSLQRVRHRHRQ